MQQWSRGTKYSISSYDSRWFEQIWCILEVLIFSPLTYNGEVTKLTWPKVTDIKKIRNIEIVDTYALTVQCAMRVSKSSDHWCAIGKMSNFEKRSLRSGLLTRAPLGYFYNASHWGAISSPPPPDLRDYWTDSKNWSGIWKPWKNCRGKTNFIDLRVTSDVTGQVKVKMFDISVLVTSASKIAMLSTNKAK